LATGEVAMNYILGVVCAAAVIWIAVSAARAGIVEAGPDHLSQTTSLGAIIAASPDQPVHILFVHGIRIGDRGSSAKFRASLCAHLKLDCSRVQRVTQRLDIGPNPGVTYMGEPVWPDDQAWSKGPFVDRYQYRVEGRSAPVILDEVNWWPLALPLRCKALLAPEAALAGPDVADLRLCAADDDVHFPFISQAELKTLIATRPRGGGAALANGFLKRGLMDWGLSDAVIALGPMKTYLRDAVDKAFEFAAAPYDGDVRPAKFVVISESLGSFIVFDAYAAHNGAARAVLDQTACLYFFANQIALLELGRLNDPSRRARAAAAALGEAAPGTAEETIHEALKSWASRPATASLTGLPAFKQIIAFSDPSDVLTFRVPKVANAIVVNVYDRNGLDLFHLVADPVAAHVGHSTNTKVLDQMLTVPR
jgi:hypothetical protein